MVVAATINATRTAAAATTMPTMPAVVSPVRGVRPCVVVVGSGFSGGAAVTAAG